MIVVPAMDIRGGKVVRLKHGELQEEHVYGSDPVQVARRFEAEGAMRLHLVDLDAAISSQPQFDTLAEIIDAVGIPVEVGGGLRVTVAGGLSTLDDLRRVRALEDVGVDEAVVGKALYEKRFTLAEAMEAVA